VARLRNGRFRRNGGPTERATSCGGIIVRQSADGAEIVLGRRDREGDRVTWSLPKGTPAADESAEETALREVAEETGLEVEILAPVGPIQYFFTQRGKRIHKTVHYYLMAVTGGDMTAHDHEFDEVAWVPVKEARSLMSFPTERDIVERALDIAANTPEPPAAA
jgi:ADP-ribose pyrophosphatase YjhB (NUDIX family)